MERVSVSVLHISMDVLVMMVGTAASGFFLSAALSQLGAASNTSNSEGKRRRKRFIE
jgi:hypothetical protein